MTEIALYFWVQLLRTYSVGLCLGVSTVAMTFYYYVVAQGQTHAAQNRMMHIVYTLLRIGMVLVIATEIILIAYHYRTHNFIYWTDNPELLMRLTAFGVIVINALAMQYRKISMHIGPALAGGSWYAYFFFSIWIETENTYGNLFTGYLIWLAGVALFLRVLRFFLTRNNSPLTASEGSAQHG